MSDEGPDEGLILRGLFPAGRIVETTDLSRLRAPHPILSTDRLQKSPWLEAVRRLGQTPEDGALDERMVPIEEGETSLNANTNQALAGLIPLVLGARQGLSPTVLGTLAGGNHGLDHSLARLAHSLPDPLETQRRLAEVFGPAALASAEPILSSHHRSLRKSFARLPSAVQRARALRLPPCVIGAPEADRLAGLAPVLDLDPALRDLLVGAREAAAQAGLATVADVFVVLRALLLNRLAGMLGARGVHVPSTLEALLSRGTGGLADRTLPDLMTKLQPVSSTPSSPRRGRGRFRALRYYDPVKILTRGSEPAGPLIQGWGWIWASHDGGALHAAPDARELLDLPLSRLLSRGYGLSGMLLYPAVRQINGGAVCNLVLSSPRPGVFAGLTDPTDSGMVLPLTWTNVNGAWQTGERLRRPPLDLLVFTQWIERSSDPAATLGRIFEAFVRASGAPGRSGLELEKTPGPFSAY